MTNSTITSDPMVTRKAMVADKAMLRTILDNQDKQKGFVSDPTATPQKSRALMLEQGIRPEDNVFSCEILRMREGEV
jgi:hypothetical protein